MESGDSCQQMLQPVWKSAGSANHPAKASEYFCTASKSCLCAADRPYSCIRGNHWLASHAPGSPLARYERSSQHWLFEHPPRITSLVTFAGSSDRWLRTYCEACVGWSLHSKPAFPSTTPLRNTSAHPCTSWSSTHEAVIAGLLH